MAKSPTTFLGVQNDFYKPNHDAAASTIVRDWGPSLTRQEFAEECDINFIMSRYEITGQLPMNNPGPPQYLDLTMMPADLQTALDLLNDAERAFMTLPAKIRREFDNDPQEFVAFASDPANLNQMREWGLAPPAQLPDAEKEKPVHKSPPSDPPSAGSAAPPKGGNSEA